MNVGAASLETALAFRAKHRLSHTGRRSGGARESDWHLEIRPLRSRSSAGSRVFIEPDRKPSRSRVTNLKPSALKMRVNSAAMRRIEGARQFVAGDFEAHNLSMMAHAELAEAEATERVFTLLDHRRASRVTGRPYSMREERQAEAGLSQTRSPACLRECANVLLRETRVEQRCRDVVLTGGLLAGAKVALVVDVHTIGDHVEAARYAKRFHDREKLVLAVKAAGRVVANVLGTIQFGRGR